ncbi:hypothetical protein PG990_001087 [Apiospora arundinis]
MAPSSSFSFETPSPSNSKGTRTRPRNIDPVAASPDDAGSKGGRSLRKRTRIDYSFDQVDDEVATASKATPTTTRSLKKRKTDFAPPGEGFDHESENRGKRRASEQPAKSTARRAQPRKTTLDPQPFVAEQLEEDVPVQDTIEVGGHHSEVSDESFHQRTNSGSSHTGSAGPLAHMTQDDQEEAQPKSEDAPIPDAIDTGLPAKAEAGTTPDPIMQASELPLPKDEVEEPPDVQMLATETSDNMSAGVPKEKPQDKPEQKPEEQPEEKPTEKPEEELDDRHEEKPQEKSEEDPKDSLEEQPAEVSGGNSWRNPKRSLTNCPKRNLKTGLRKEQPTEQSTKQPTEQSTKQPTEQSTEQPSPPPLEQPTEQPETQDELQFQEKSEVELNENLEVQSIEKVEETPIQKTEEKADDKSLYQTQEKPIKTSPKRSSKRSPKRSPVKKQRAVEKEENHGPYAYLTPYLEDSKVMYPAALEDETVEPEVTHEVPEDLAAFEAVDEAGDEDTPAGTPAATANNSPVPEADIPTIQPPAKKQYQFKQPRAAEELTSLFDDIDSLTEVDLYDRLAAVNHVLVAWQEEWVRMKKIVDDEDNAVKYQAEEAAFLQREKMALSKDPDAMPLRKDYQVRGIRAPKEDSTVLYQRQQDRVMASAYLFEYDDRDSKIGMQDPMGQRRGIGKGRLRDRPKQTAKAAELDDVVNPNVVHGKRTRKPVNLFGDVEAASRSSTPVPTQPPPAKRRRGRPNGEDNGDSHLSFSSQPEAPVEETPKKRGRGGRAKKPNAPTSVPDDPSTDNEAQPDPDEVEERPSRKRRRKAFHDEEYLDHDNNEPEVITGRAARARRNSRLTEVPTGSFYSTTSMPSTQGHDESRPNTSSSTATASTTVSAYGLREKRQKKFSNGENEGGFEDGEEQRKPKRVRRPTKKTQASEVADGANDGPEPVPEPTPEPAIVAPKMTKIKIKNFNGNTGSFTSAVPAPTSHPANVPMSNGPGPVQINHAQGPPNGNGPPHMAPRRLKIMVL